MFKLKTMKVKNRKTENTIKAIIWKSVRFLFSDMKTFNKQK